MIKISSGRVNAKIKYQVVKVSPGGLLTGGEALLPSLPLPPHSPICPIAPTEVVETIVGFRVPTTSFGTKGQGGVREQGGKGELE